MKESHAKFLSGVLKHFDSQSGELVHVMSALGRVVSSDVRAKFTSPHKDLSAVNGYAISSGGTHIFPYRVKIVGESTSKSPFLDELAAGQAVKVAAGSTIPIGSETVMLAGDIDIENGYLIISKPVLMGQNICYAGVDFVENEVVLRAGSVLTARDIGLAASMKVSWLPVRRKPKIAVFAVGDELAMLGECSDLTKMPSSSSLVISAFVEACGASLINLGVAGDSEMSIRKLVESANGCDLIVTTGGISLSADNLLKKMFEKKPVPMEANLDLSSPTKVIFGNMGESRLLALPGNPISAQICATLFLRPIINCMTNMQQKFYKKSFAILDRNLDVNDKEMDYIFGRLLETDDKRLKVLPASSYDRLLMSALSASDCLVTVDDDNVLKGDSVSIARFVCSVVSG